MTAALLTAVGAPMVRLAAAGAEDGPEPSLISPGLVGFLATFGLVVMSIFLFVNMTGRLRRLDHRAKQAQEATDRARPATDSEPRPEPEGPGATGGEGAGGATTGTDGDPPR